jgi:hypothetical protein
MHTQPNWGVRQPIAPRLTCLTPMASFQHAPATSSQTKANARDRGGRSILNQTTVKGLTLSLTHSKQRRRLFPVKGKQGFSIFNQHPTQPLLALRSSLENHEKINRHTGLIEPLVSHSKQRIATQINRHTSRGPSFPFSLFSFPFSLRPFTLPMSSTSHSPLVTSHWLSNRNPKILESHLSPLQSVSEPVLIANFEPTHSLSPAAIQVRSCAPRCQTPGVACWARTRGNWLEGEREPSKCGILPLRLIQRLCCAVVLDIYLIFEDPPSVVSEVFSVISNQDWQGRLLARPKDSVRATLICGIEMQH